MKHEVRKPFRGGNRHGGNRRPGSSGAPRRGSSDGVRKGHKVHRGSDRPPRGGSNRPGAIKKARRFNDDRKGRPQRGSKGDRRGRGGLKRRDDSERVPKDPAAVQQILDEQLLRFQAKHGINTEHNTEQIQKLQQNKIEQRKNRLDNQLAEFMAKAKQQKEQAAQQAQAAATTGDEAPREIVESK